MSRIIACTANSNASSSISQTSFSTSSSTHLHHLGQKRLVHNAVSESFFKFPENAEFLHQPSLMFATFLFFHPIHSVCLFLRISSLSHQQPPSSNFMKATQNGSNSAFSLCSTAQFIEYLLSKKTKSVKLSPHSKTSESTIANC